MNTNMPDSPGEWWFIGVAIVPHSMRPAALFCVRRHKTLRFVFVNSCRH